MRRQCYKYFRLRFSGSSSVRGKYRYRTRAIRKSEHPCAKTHTSKTIGKKKKKIAESFTRSLSLSSQRKRMCHTVLTDAPEAVPSAFDCSPTTARVIRLTLRSACYNYRVSTSIENREIPYIYYRFSFFSSVSCDTLNCETTPCVYY